MADAEIGMGCVDRVFRRIWQDGPEVDVHFSTDGNESSKVDLWPR
jgi:hypothetical protein